MNGSDPWMPAEELRRLMAAPARMDTAESFPPALRSLLREFHDTVMNVSGEAHRAIQALGLDVDAMRGLTGRS